MIFRFEDFELNTEKGELRSAGTAVHVEPQVFALLVFLIENRDRLITKDEIVETVWQGRIVSDSVIGSRIRLARQALNDDGTAQRLIATAHGRGFRFVGAVHTEAPATPPSVIALPAEAEPAGEPIELVQAPVVVSSKPGVAVLPFGRIGADERYPVLTHALPHELIAALSRLRWLSVIARGSAFQLHSDSVDLRSVGATLGVSYCLTGMIELFASELTIAIELADTRDLRIVFTDRYTGKVDNLAEMRSRIVADVVGELEVQIPLNEAQWARFAGIDNIDAWGAFHLGLQHMYRSNPGDIKAAQSLFERAIKLDPTMARAQAALSYTHFQNAYMHYNPDRDGSIFQARMSAEKGFELDPLDPFVNFSLGRSYWLEDDMEAGIGWLERATDLSPNYSQGFYARAWHGMAVGQAAETVAHADMASKLSPIDPLHYAVLGVRGFGLLYGGDLEAAADSVERGAQICGKHPIFCLGAAYVHHCAGNRDRAAFWSNVSRQKDPNVGADHFLVSVPFRDQNLRQHIRNVLGGYL